MSEQALRLPEAAKRLMCTITHLYTLHHREELIIRKLGGRAFILADDVDRILRNAPAMTGGPRYRRRASRTAEADV